MSKRKSKSIIPRGLKTNAWSRNVSASVAGLRAGTALAADSAFQRFRRADANEQQGSAFARKEARKLVDELGRLKGTYVKIGQMIALLGEHFLPPVLTDALHDLATQTEPLAWEVIQPVLARNLGVKCAELDVNPIAIAAASLAQVHRARIIATGEEICLKIQYPGLAEVIDSDFDAVLGVLKMAKWLPAGRDMDDWVQSMREHLHNEIDYLREADLARQLHEHVQTLDRSRNRLAVPGIFERYSSGEVLALEYIDGVSVLDETIRGLPLHDRNELGKTMLELFFLELFEWDLVQTDPNFGNYLIRHAEDGLELVMLDFGSVLRPDHNFLVHLRETIAAGVSKDEPGIVAGLTGLGCLPPASDPAARRLFIEFCEHLLEPLQEPTHISAAHLNAEGQYRWAHTGLMKRAAKKAAENATSRHFTPPGRDFALITRKLSGVFTFIAVLEAEFNGAAVTESYLSERRFSA